jgi:hypothetical protein
MVRRSLSAVVVARHAMLAGACGSGGGNPYGGSTPTTATPPSAASRNAAEVNPPGDIPDNQVFVAYRPPGGRFMVKVPEGWARVRQGGTVTFTDKLNTISMESRPAPAAPTVASARQAELPAIRSASRRYELGEVTWVRRAAGGVVLVTYKANAPADPVTGKVVHDAVERYEYWRGGTEAILTLAGPVGADNVDPWRIVSDSFRWR